MWTKAYFCFHLVCCCSLHTAPSVIMSVSASRYLWPCGESFSQVSLERTAFLQFETDCVPDIVHNQYRQSSLVFYSWSPWHTLVKWLFRITKPQLLCELLNYQSSLHFFCHAIGNVCFKTRFLNTPLCSNFLTLWIRALMPTLTPKKTQKNCRGCRDTFSN